MSFLKDYNARKKKKQNEELLSIVNKVSGDKEELSYADIFGSDYLKKLSALERQNDIAPVSNDVTRRMTTNRSAFDRMTIGPVKTEDNSLNVARTILGLGDDSLLQFAKIPDSYKDGVDFKDILETAQGTTRDLSLNALKGAGGLVEGVADLLGYKLANDAKTAANLFGVENVFGERVKDFTKRNMVDELTGGLQADIDQHSALGRTGKGIAQGIGQAGAILATGGIAGAAGATSAGTSALTTLLTGFSGAGSGMSEAYEGGATDEEAATYGLIAGAADALTELLFGGMGKSVKALGLSTGLSSVDDMVAKAVSSKIKSTLWKNIVQFGVKSGFEGLEEVLAGFTQAVGKKLTYMSEEDLGQIIQDENLLEQFVVGAFTSGLTQSGAVTGVNEGSLIDTIQTGKDFITGFSQNEQAVIKAETEKRIAQQETDGKKLTKNEKRAIEAQVEKDMDKGFISTDTIEETLGGETYQNYKKTIDSEDALVKQEKDLSEESKKLEGMVWEKMTGEQQTRRDELRKTLPELRNKIAEQEKTSTRNQLKEQMQNQVKDMVKEDRLVESYNEQGRRKEAFTADLTKYDAKQQEIVKKAMDSGVFNNTNRTHDFVDWIAKVAAKLDKTFDFTNNEKLKESGFALNGKVINGFVNKDGVTINIQSAKALNTVVGHEITHVLEGTDLYTELQNAIVAYAKNKGDYQSRYDTLAELYKGIEGANIDAELTADLVGDYLFTDEDFVNRLSGENRSLFEKIFDEIKYLFNLATAGSKEARELEKVKRAFEKAFRDGAQKNTADSGVKYSVTESFTDSNGNQFDNAVLLDTDFFDDVSPRNWGEKLRTMVNERASSDPFILPIVDENGNTAVLQFAKPNERIRKDGGSEHRVLDKLSSSSDNISKLAVVHIDEIVSVSEENLPYHTSENSHGWFDKNGWLHRNANVINRKNGNIYNLSLDIAKTADGRTILYATDGKIKKVGNVNVNSLKIKGSRQDSDSENKVAQKEETVNWKIEPNEIKITDEQNEKGLDTKQEVDFSLSRDTEYMDHAIDLNESAKNVSSDVMLETKAVRERVATRMNEIKDRGLVGLPEDIEGNTYIANSSYDGTEENTTICPRSLASEAFVDAVSEYLGRPLSVEEQIYISQDLQGRSLTPECTYCYVATDRKAYRAFLGDYVSQRDSVIDKIKRDPNADTSREGALYKDFLNGRKDTSPMYNRFKMWVDAYKSGKPMIEASHLANMNKLMGDINSEFGEELRPQIVDAMKYAQSASWAKKRVNYVAYNGHILKWKQDRIKKLNSHYGLRMYSFSDFHPAFVLENMQMITDASVRGLKMLGYTKDTDFVEIFAPSGMNINVSTFGFEANGNVYENNLIGAEWEKAKALREKFPNVGITFVATNDAIVNWALAQDWIDVVIPYHLVRTGAEVAKAFNYTNYTSESADTKTSEWTKGDKKSIAPTEHNNDLETYLKALEENHLKPRFERFIDNPNYMKLVNEFRQSASESKPVQPVFDEDAAMVALAKLEANGYYQPIGGSVERMYEIAAEVAEDMTSQIAPSKNSLSYYGEDRKTSGNYNVFTEDVALDTNDVAPTADSTEEAAPTAKSSKTAAPYEDNWKDSFESITDQDAPPVKEISTVQDKIQQKITNTQIELDKNRQRRDQSARDYDEEISRLRAEYDAKKNKNSMAAQGILRSVERLSRIKGNIDADYAKRISDLEAKLEKLHSQEYSRAEHRRDKQEGYTSMWEDMIGDTSTWKDFKLGLSYKTKTLRRILRKVVRDSNGNPDIAKADRIYNELETKYDHNEALLKRESQKLKEVFSKLDLNSKEDTYAHMLGELRHNPETTLTQDAVDEYYNKYKKQIDTDKVDTAIAEARKTFDDLIVRVNEVLREQGMKEIPYRQGYFPHFTNPKQGWLAKLLNWKTIDTEIPTSIAGLTEAFKPQRSWQSFNKQRTGDTTDYSLYQGLDTYIHGALDWIYHIEDLQKRRSLENLIRYTHSEEGIKERIREIKNSDYDAEEAQEMIDAVLKEANNHLSGLVRELMNRTNTLANKKSSMDRGMEDALNRKIYSTMTNLNNRVNANMVVGSFSSALTNFIPMVQSWHQVSPAFTVKGLGDFIRSTVKDDGMIEKSDFLTNRLVEEEKLYQTTWDKISNKAAFMMNAIDNITSQTVWRSKYLQNMKDGMTESQAIADADQFAKNLMAGRSRGNAPTIFDAKNPLIKIATAFQLEVANQYGYMFEDVPQDTKNKARLVKGYATAFLGAYLYNALYSSLVGRDAAFDPIGIIEDLLRGLFDEEEEPEDVVLGFAENILDEMPFVSGLTGGGRIPIASAFPYSGESNPFESMLTDVTEGKWDSFGKELLKPLYYLAMPVAGGQIKKSVEGLSMFSDDHPVAGSYTDSGSLRFPVEDNLANRVQAGLFGQYSSQNAREYFDNDIAPLKENQINEYMDLGAPIGEYWDYREGLRDVKTQDEKLAYINSLDFTEEQKDVLKSYLFDEAKYAEENPEKYKFLEDEGIGYLGYKQLDEETQESWSWAFKHPEEYKYLKEKGVYPEDYSVYRVPMLDFKDAGDAAYEWAFNNSEKATLGKVFKGGVKEYRQYSSELSNIKADRDKNGKVINGSAKQKKIAYINGLKISEGEKLILIKSLYPSDDTNNAEISNYVKNKASLSMAEKKTILTELGFKVSSNGVVTW